MTKIIIDDGFNDEYKFEESNTEPIEWEVCGLYDVLNTREIRMRIAYKFLDEEHITEKAIKKEIDKYLQPLKDEILDETIDNLNANGYETIEQIIVDEIRSERSSQYYDNDDVLDKLQEHNIEEDDEIIKEIHQQMKQYTDEESVVIK